MTDDTGFRQSAELDNLYISTEKQQPLQPGQRAPDFTLPTGDDETVSLRDFRGQPVVLAFYPADWSPTCGDQMALYNEILPEFERFDAQLLGISVDGVWCHRAFAEDRNLAFPLLSDFEPKGEVARRYEVYRSEDGVAERALFVISEGIIEWSYISPPGVNPGANGVLGALRGLPDEQELVETLTRPVSDSDHAQGPEDAPVTLVQYGDFECGYCDRAHEVIEDMREEFGDDLRVVFRHFPLTLIHSHAQHAAEAAEAAGVQGKFWAMCDRLYETDELDDEGLRRHAADVGLDTEQFKRELNDHVHAERVRSDFESGVKSGVNGTPTLFVNGVKHEGSWHEDELRDALETAIERSTKGDRGG